MIQNVNIKSYKCLANENLAFRPLTILTGINSAGKSSVLQGILLLARNCNSKNRERMYNLISKYQNLPIDIKITIDDKEYSYNWESKEQNNENILDYENNLYFLSANRIGTEEIAKLSQEYKVGEYGEYLFGSFSSLYSKSLISELGLQSNTYFKNFIATGLNNKMPVINNSLMPDISITEINMKDILIALESNTNLPQDIYKIFNFGNQLNIWLAYITGNNSYLLTVEPITSDSVKVAFVLEDGKTYSPFNLGDGTSYLAKVLIICFLAKKGDIVIIENPAVHLHPKAQSKLGEFFVFMAANGRQIILETHCEHLLNNIRYQVYQKSISPEDVVIYYKSGIDNNFEEFRINANGHYADARGCRKSFPDGFFDASLNQLLEMG